MLPENSLTSPIQVLKTVTPGSTTDSCHLEFFKLDGEDFNFRMMKIMLQLKLYIPTNCEYKRYEQLNKAKSNGEGRGTYNSVTNVILLGPEGDEQKT